MSLQPFTFCYFKREGLIFFPSFCLLCFPLELWFFYLFLFLFVSYHYSFPRGLHLWLQKKGGPYSHFTEENRITILRSHSRPVVEREAESTLPETQTTTLHELLKYKTVGKWLTSTTTRKIIWDPNTQREGKKHVARVNHVKWQESSDKADSKLYTSRQEYERHRLSPSSYWNQSQ